eukprot:4981585-Amphidinium_carterae.1
MKMCLSLNKEKLRKPWNEVSSDLFGEEAFPFHTMLRMTSARERVLEAITQHQWRFDSIPLQEVDEIWRRDKEVVLTAVQQDWRAFQFAAEALKGDCEFVLTAVKKNGFALEYATEALRADREVVLLAVRRNGLALKYAAEALRADPEVVQAAVQENELALPFAADCLLEDPTFATEAKRDFFYVLKLTMLSGRSTVVAAESYWQVENVLAECRRRLGLSDDGATIELLHGSERVPDYEAVGGWPGIQPPGKISEYELLVTR